MVSNHMIRLDPRMTAEYYHMMLWDSNQVLECRKEHRVEKRDRHTGKILCRALFQHLSDIRRCSAFDVHVYKRLSTNSEN